MCWGNNTYGQLGNNSFTDSAVPVNVIGLSSGVIAVSAGCNHTCALTSAGTVMCWGFNYDGELGNNSTTDSSVPVDVVGLSSGVVAVSAGVDHTCAVTSAGAVLCWGDDYDGELGVLPAPNTQNILVPVSMSRLASDVIAISAGGSYTCAITSAGALQCWGSSPYGPDTTFPVEVQGLSSGVIAVSAGDEHACAVTSASAVLCWGYNGYGELGNNSTTTTPISGPVDVQGLSSGVIAVSAGDAPGGGGAQTCSLTSAGAVMCWGDNTYGQLGNNSFTDSAVPVNVIGFSSGVVAVSAGGYHTCAVTSAGAVMCWGDNTYGQLGNNSFTDSAVPVGVTGL
jgi:alpha-tubulin suppressor-like RCC1 family protein